MRKSGNTVNLNKHSDSVNCQQIQEILGNIKVKRQNIFNAYESTSCNTITKCQWWFQSLQQGHDGPISTPN